MFDVRAAPLLQKIHTIAYFNKLKYVSSGKTPQNHPPPLGTGTSS